MIPYMELIRCSNGWYYQRNLDWKVTQLFDTREDAIEARNTDELRWS